MQFKIQNLFSPIFGLKVTGCLSFIIVLMTFVSPVLAADCSDVAPVGDLDVTTACAFSGTVNGVDQGSGSSNTANLTVSPSGTLTILDGQTVAMGSLTVGGGTIVIVDGGQMKFGTPLWMEDQDIDGYPAATAQYAQTTSPVNGRRRNELVSINTVDTNDTQSCPQGNNPEGTCKKCFQGGVVNQNDGEDIFFECSAVNTCNGLGNCRFNAKRVFLTSTTSRGNLFGLSGADDTCQTRANTVSLGGIWKAWLSDGSTSAASRLDHSSLPYALVDKTTKIADNWTDLTDGNLDASINKDEYGNPVSSSNPVWTNTTGSGNIYTSQQSQNCTGWVTVAAARTGRIGLNDLFSSINWTDSSGLSCHDQARLYCFEQQLFSQGVKTSTPLRCVVPHTLEVSSGGRTRLGELGLETETNAPARITR